MNRLSAVVCAGAFAFVVPQAALADEVIDWNNAYLNAVRATGGGPGPASRNAAIVHAAIYDAVNSITDTRVPYLANFNTAATTSKQAAVAAAGYRTLSALYGAGNPALQAQFDSLYASQLASIPSGASKSDGIMVGTGVANILLAQRATDGHDNTTPYVEQAGPGNWRSTYAPVGAQAVGPNWGNVTPFTMNNGAQFRPPPPPSLTSAAYTAAWQEVRDFGGAVSSMRTADQTQMAWFWGNDRDGSYKPPGHLNRLTQVISEQQFAGLTADQRLEQNARLFATVNVGLADAVVVAWDCKFNTEFDLWRPIAGIREADTDGNPATTADPTWEPLSYAGIGGPDYTPPFPAYISGHSTMAGAHAEIMRQFFGTDSISFTLDTDDADAAGVTRSFTSFTQAEWENALSRIYLGVHWRFDSEEGVLCGRDVGNWVFGHFGQVVPAPASVCVLGGLAAAAARRRR